MFDAATMHPTPTISWNQRETGAPQAWTNRWSSVGRHGQSSELSSPNCAILDGMSAPSWPSGHSDVYHSGPVLVMESRNRLRGGRIGSRHQSSRFARNTGCAGSRRPSTTSTSRPRIFGGRLPERRVAAFPLNAAARRVDQREVAASGVLHFEEPVRHVRITSLAEYIHQGHGPLAPSWIADDLPLHVFPVVHAPEGHTVRAAGADRFRPEASAARREPQRLAIP